MANRENVYRTLSRIKRNLRGTDSNIKVVGEKGDEYTIRVTTFGGVFYERRTFTGDDIVKDDGKIIKDFIKEVTGKEDAVNHPSHYTRGGIEVHDFITAWDLGFDDGNVIKYVTRAPYKGKELEDLKKARWYLDKLIERAEKNG